MKTLTPNNCWLAAIAAAMICVSCYTVPQTGRQTLNFISVGTEMQLGLQAFDEIKKKEKVCADPVSLALVQRVAPRIAAVANPDIPNAKWEFVLFENKELNAFALPGGKVGVYTGILEVTQDDHGLATVISHEIAHVAARHGAERMSEQLALAGLATGLSIGLEASGESRRTRNLSLVAFGVVTALGAVLPHSRLQESEADRIGLMYMAKAGYPPKAAIAFWQRMTEFSRKRGGRPPAFLSTHPSDERRIADLQRLLPEAEVYYQTSGKAGGP